MTTHKAQGIIMGNNIYIFFDKKYINWMLFKGPKCHRDIFKKCQIYSK
jgi:hypothetical protein